ncbi:hypothetical protein QE374_002495 [Microbacterium sp. SORGH_AS428]|nr:hypothetical protein [Microbacterium sp. SORGH_AS_0428]
MAGLWVPVAIGPVPGWRSSPRMRVVSGARPVAVGVMALPFEGGRKRKGGQWNWAVSVEPASARVALSGLSAVETWSK